MVRRLRRRLLQLPHLHRGVTLVYLRCHSLQETRTVFTHHLPQMCNDRHFQVPCPHILPMSIIIALCLLPPLHLNQVKGNLQ